MIVCHEHKFIFLKTRKTAGTSIELMLSELCGSDDIITPMPAADEERRERGPQNHRGLFNPLPELFEPGAGKRRSLRDVWQRRKFFNHMSAAQARNRLPTDVWRSYFKFCFERNPWDKMVSRFHWDNRNRNVPLTWEEFLAAGEFRSDLGLYIIDDALAVDFVGKYEHLEGDLKTALARVSVSTNMELPNAKAGHRTGSPHYRECYTDVQRDIVARAFAREIEMFGYEF